MRGIINIVIGVVLIIGGLSGSMSRGTGGSGRIIAIGAVLIAFGVFRLARSNA